MIALEERFNAFLNKLAGSIEGVEDEKEMLLRLIIAMAVFLALTVFRKQIAKGVIWLCTRPFAKISTRARSALKNSLAKPLSFLIFVGGIFISSEIIAPAGEIRSKLLLVLKLGLIISTSWFAINFIGSDFFISLSSDDSKSKKTAINFITNFSKWAVGVIAVLLVLEQFGISATRIFTALGIGGVAVAFACKDTVENMLSGFIIIFDKPFEVEDSISIDGETGTVEDIRIRTTRLRMSDGSEKVYPNTTVASSPIVNLSNVNKRSFNETLWLNYKHSGDEVHKFCADLKALIHKYDDIIEGDVGVDFLEYGVHALEVNLFFYITTVDSTSYRDFKTRLNCEIKDLADSTGIDLAFTSQTVYFGDSLEIKK